MDRHEVEFSKLFSDKIKIICNMRNTLWICLIPLCLFSKITSAQVYVDLINAGYNYNMTSQYSGFDNSYSQQTRWVNVNIPFVLNDKGDILTPNFQYSFTQLNHDFFEEDELQLHYGSIGLSWLKNWENSHWASYASLGTSINSDLKKLNGEHYNYEASLLFFYGKKDELVWNFGLNYTGGSFGNYFVPLIGVDWKINNRATLSYQTFSHFQFDYGLTPKIFIGAVAHSSPFSFNISDYYEEQNSYVHTYSEEFPYTPQSIGVYTDIYLQNELVLFGKLSYEFSKTLSHENAQGEFINDSPYQGDINSGLALELGIAWRKRTARKFRYQ